MACYDIVVDYLWTIDLMIICYLRIACYDIVKDSKWMVYLFGEL